MVLNSNSKLGIIRNTLMIYQKNASLYYINHSFVKCLNIVLLGHLILLCITKKSKKKQIRTTKLVKSVTNFPYCDIFKMLGLTTLYYRRLRLYYIGYWTLNKYYYYYY